MGDSMIFIYDDKVNITEYNELCYLNNEIIKINIGRDHICITGNDLYVEYFDCIEIRVCGKIRSIVYENRV